MYKTCTNPANIIHPQTVTELIPSFAKRFALREIGLSVVSRLWGRFSNTLGDVVLRIQRVIGCGQVNIIICWNIMEHVQVEILSDGCLIGFLRFRIDGTSSSSAVCSSNCSAKVSCESQGLLGRYHKKDLLLGSGFLLGQSKAQTWPAWSLLVIFKQKLPTFEETYGQSS